MRAATTIDAGLCGSLPSATVSDYRPATACSIHWPSSARQSRLMVKDLEIEPSGDVWIVLDLNRMAHTLDSPNNTLEHGVIVAASLAAELLSGGERRAVGLLAASVRQARTNSVPSIPSLSRAKRSCGASSPALARFSLVISPLAELLFSSREMLGRRRTDRCDAAGGIAAAKIELKPSSRRGEALTVEVTPDGRASGD